MKLMFAPERLREALCIVAIQCTYRDLRAIDSGSVFARLCMLMRADSNIRCSPLHIEEVITEDAQIVDCRNIAPTIRRLLMELDDLHTIIV